MAYDHKRIETDWQRKWREQGTFRAANNSRKPKYYVLDMFPYPSGAGLHVGHPLGYIASDIVARYKRHCGFNVLHPMGYDSFGLPAEQYAIQTGQHPAKTTEENAARYREQLDRIGFSFDWDREVRTSDPDFYHWTQWIFLQLFNSWYDARQGKARPISELIARFEGQGCQGQDASVLTGDTEEFIGAFTAQEWKNFDERTRQLVLQRFRLAYLGDAWVNWCPALGTVLANDEVKDGVSERGGHPVERKRMPQWSLRITAYAQRLLDGLDQLDWSESIKEAQRNWIGRSEGATVRFTAGDDFIEVFTTRPDTLFGVSFLTLAPEHPLVARSTMPDRRAEVEAYVATAKNRSERERQAEVDKVSGVFTGSYAKHPFTGADVPVWVGDYVLGGYGTGAVMAVPGGDQRDWRFAKHFGLPIIAVTEGADIEKEADERKDAVICSEGFLKGMKVPQAITRAIQELEKIGAGEGKVNFRLRDAAFGRQRYWGEPIPIYYKDDIPYPLPESELPLKLPEVDKFLPTESGEPPLARAKDWYYSPSPREKGPGDEAHYSPLPGRGAGGEGNLPLETTTMPGWAGSSWYFLRYTDPKNAGRFASAEAINYWQQIDLYVGGSEHATGHLLYFRFWTKFLYDLGLIPFDEPAKKLVNQGMIGGMSAFVWALTKWGRSGMEVEELFETMNTRESRPVIYFSSKQKDKLESSGSMKEAIRNVVAKHLPESESWDFSYTVSKMRVLIDHVTERNTLDIDAFVGFQRQHGSVRPMEFLTDEDGTIDCLREQEKMSKSKLNVVNPDDFIGKYGADTLRLYEMFLGPLEQSKPWDTNGIEGTFRFLKKFWNLFQSEGALREPQGTAQGTESALTVTEEAPNKAELKVLHATLKKVTEDIGHMSFNTSVAQFMIAVNELGALKCRKRAILEPLTIALAPFAPHIAEEIWMQLGHTESISTAPWPQWEAQYLEEDSFSYPISFNGKTRLQLEFPVALGKEEVEAAVLANPEVQARLEGKAPKKVIVVPKRIVNIVV